VELIAFVHMFDWIRVERTTRHTPITFFGHVNEFSNITINVIEAFVNTLGLSTVLRGSDTKKNSPSWLKILVGGFVGPKTRILGPFLNFFIRKYRGVKAIRNHVRPKIRIPYKHILFTANNKLIRVRQF
jgi:hypothetical protein